MSDNVGMDFEKEGIVSVWFSTVPYADIPGSYFDEDEQGLCAWAHNFKIGPYNHDTLETNGTNSGMISVTKAVGECSYSSSYVDAVVKKINKMGADKLTWVILLFDFEYRVKKTKVYEDKYVQYVGAYAYDMNAHNVIEPS